MLKIMLLVSNKMVLIENDAALLCVTMRKRAENLNLNGVLAIVTLSLSDLILC